MSAEKTILAGWMIDGTGAPAREKVLVRIRNGVFEEIRPFSHSAVNPSELIDFSEYTLLPALVDAHVHLSMSGTIDQDIRKRQLSDDLETAKKCISRNLAQLLSHGVLAVRDGGDRNGYAQRYKENAMDVQYAAISLRVAGKAWHKPGRYGSFVGRALLKGRLADGIYSENRQIDHIKIIQSGLNSLTHFGKESLPQFHINELKEAIAVAADLGLKTMVHANGRLPVGIALAAGCSSVEHGFFMGEGNLARMAEMGIFWVPTAFAMKACGACVDEGGAERLVAMKNLECQLEQMTLARRLGVSLAVGTDAGSIGVHHGSAVIDELQLFLEAGFSIEEAIKCASLNGANLLGLERKGRIQKGWCTDFIVAKGSPSSLPESLNDIFRIHAGERFL
ncbi:amidohydrolase family protein [delta proteobacterium NaphS2]|nr:amidohydrolase family protein [delta proteobacterium NaphS2]